MKAKKFNPAHFARIHIDREKIASAFHTLATGGEWAISQPAATRRNLTWFWLDGLFASGSDNIVVTYMSVYLLALGATQAQIGLMSSISSLTAALVLLPGAWLVERLGRRMVIVLTSSGWARVALLFLALIPFLLSGNALIMVAMALSISRDAMANLSFPAWMAITGDIVPIEGRGRYFASRNFIMSITGMIAIFLVGLLITHSSGLTGFQIAFALAFVIGSGSLFSFSHIHDQPHHPSTPPIPTPAPRDETSVEQEPAETVQKKHTPLDDLRELFAYPDFIQFAGVTALWNIALNFAGPFFTVYLVKNLGANATMVSLTTIASSVSGMLAQLKLGELHDRWGPRKLTMISGLLIPIVPLAWAFIDSPWYVIPINLVSGSLWGAYGMGSFNYLLTIIPGDRRARFSAIFQVVVTASLAIGAALGSLTVSSPWGFTGVFIGSAIGRLAAALLFVRLGRRNKARKSSST